MSNGNDNGEVFYDNLLPLAVISGVNIDPDFPVDKCHNENQGAVCVGIAGQEVIINITFTANTAISGIVVFNHNLAAGDTFMFECSNDNFEHVVQSESIDHTKGYVNVTWDFPYYRLRMQKVSGAVQVGELFLPGNFYKFDRNFKWGTGADQGLKFTEVKTNGPVYRNLKEKRVTMPLDFDNVPETQKEIFKTVNENRYVCFVPKPSAKIIYYGSFTFTAWEEKYFDNWVISGYFEENAK